MTSSIESASNADTLDSARLTCPETDESTEPQWHPECSSYGAHPFWGHMDIEALPHTLTTASHSHSDNIDHETDTTECDVHWQHTGVHAIPQSHSPLPNLIDEQAVSHWAAWEPSFFDVVDESSSAVDIQHKPSSPSTFNTIEDVETHRELGQLLRSYDSSPHMQLDYRWPAHKLY